VRALIHKSIGALVVAGAVTLALAGGSSGRPMISCIEPVPPANAYMYFVYNDPGCGGTGTTSYDWGVDPAYTGDYYPDQASADAAEPPPPAPVTPALPTWRNLYDWPNGHGYVGWHTAGSSQPGAYATQPALGGQYGLWLWPTGGDTYSYQNGNYAEYTYSAPGTTRLTSATIDFSYRNKLLAHHCIDIGFRDASGAVIAHNEHCKPVTPPDSQRAVTISLVDPAPNPTSKVLYLRIRVDCGGATTCSKNIPQLDPLSTGGYLRVTRADITLVDDDNPVVTASGPFRVLEGRYINGTQAYDLTVSATDAGAGISRSWAERIGTGEIVSSNAPCDPTHHTDALDNRICPASYTFTGSVATPPFPEGEGTYVAKSKDPALNVGASAPWAFPIDRSAPAAATGTSLDYFSGLGSDARVVFNPGADPALPDGVPGSGTQQYQYRYALNGGAWTAWTTAAWDGFHVVPTAAGDSAEVQVREFDAVGNGSTIVDTTFAITATGSAGPSWDSADCNQQDTIEPASCFDQQPLPDDDPAPTGCTDSVSCDQSFDALDAAGLPTDNLRATVGQVNDLIANPDANGLPTFGTSSVLSAHRKQAFSFTGRFAWFDWVLYPRSSHVCAGQPFTENGYCGILWMFWREYTNGEPRGLTYISSWRGYSGGNWNSPYDGRNNPARMWYPSVGPIPDHWGSSEQPRNEMLHHVGYLGGYLAGGRGYIYVPNTDDDHDNGLWPLYFPIDPTIVHELRNNRGATRSYFEVHGGHRSHEYENLAWKGTLGCIRLKVANLLTLRDKWIAVAGNKRLRPGPVLFVDYPK